MENIDIIIIAGVSFLLVAGGLFIGLYFARRTGAERAAKLEEREERVLRMRAKLEHDRFSVSTDRSDDQGMLDEDLFRGFKEELEQERMELDIRREEIELDMRMLEDENDRLKSRLTGRGATGPSIVSDADATIVNEGPVESAAEIEDAVFADADDEISNAQEVNIDAESDSDSDSDAAADTAEVEKARNTIFGDFYFDEAAMPDFADLPEDDAGPKEEILLTDDGWSSEPDEQEPIDVDVKLTEPVGGDGAALTSRPEAASTPADAEGRSTPGPPAFDHMLTADADVSGDGSIEQVLDLCRSDLALMNDLGYGTLRSIADLSEDEIIRIAEAFDISERTIREDWIPGSRMRAAREPRA